MQNTLKLLEEYRCDEQEDRCFSSTQTDSVTKLLFIGKLSYTFDAVPIKITTELLKLEKKIIKLPWKNKYPNIREQSEREKHDVGRDQWVLKQIQKIWQLKQYGNGSEIE